MLIHPLLMIPAALTSRKKKAVMIASEDVSKQELQINHEGLTDPGEVREEDVGNLILRLKLVARFSIKPEGRTMQMGSVRRKKILTSNSPE